MQKKCCSTVGSATALAAFEQDAASPKARRKAVVHWDDTQQKNGVELEGRKAANEECAEVEVSGKIIKRNERNKSIAQVESRLRQGCRGSAGRIQAHSWVK